MSAVSFSSRVGSTPLVLLSALSSATQCKIYGKAEFLNPGGSVKDRPALEMIESSERRGELDPVTGDGLVIEATAGNTGIALAHAANERGYRCVFYAAPSTSPEKVEKLESLGAQVVVCPAVGNTEPLHFQNQAKARAQAEREAGTRAIWTNQFDNLENSAVHRRTTGPEIWRQTEGQLHCFVTSCGTGGTLSGISQFLKSVAPSLQVYLVDPPGTVLEVDEQAHRVRVKSDAELAAQEEALAALGCQTKTCLEGIGSGRLYDNLKEAVVDRLVRVTDEAAISMVHYVMQNEGLFLGSSSGANVLAAYLVAKHLGPGHTIVTILCDSGDSYRSKIFSPDWLQSKRISARLQHPDPSDLSFTHSCFSLNPRLNLHSE